MPIGYLVSRFPAISHTFILREITTLRSLGLEVVTASINSSDYGISGVEAVELKDNGSVFCVKQQGALTFLRAFGYTLRHHSIALIKGVFLSLWRGGGSWKRTLYFFAYLAEAIMVGHYFSTKKVKHLHLHFVNPGSTVGLFVHDVFGMTISMTVHGPDSFFDTTGQLLREKVRACQHVVCISDYCRGQIMTVVDPKDHDKLKVIPLGVDPQVFKQRPRSSNQVVRILCVGRAVAAKGLFDLLEAMKLLLDKGCSIELIHIGTGSQLEVLKVRAQELKITEKVTFFGAVDQTGVYEQLQQADIFVLPSYAEGLPIALMEAMACKIPCVSTYVAGIPELIRDQQNGLLVPAGKVHMLAGAIEHLIENPALREQLGVAARKTIVEEFDIRQNVIPLKMLLCEEELVDLQKEKGSLCGLS